MEFILHPPESHRDVNNGIPSVEWDDVERQITPCIGEELSTPLRSQQRYPEQRGSNPITEKKINDEDSHQQRIHIVTRVGDSILELRPKVSVLIALS